MEAVIAQGGCTAYVTYEEFIYLTFKYILKILQSSADKISSKPE